METDIKTLKTDEIKSGTKVLDLARSCVRYKVDVYVERNNSSLNTFDNIGKYYMPIRKAADWNTFRQKVADAAGQTEVNARLYADISVSTACGSAASPFKGHFDGNGHIVTASISGSGVQALYAYARDYTIEGLHLKGSVSVPHRCFLSVGIGPVCIQTTGSELPQIF